MLIAVLPETGQVGIINKNLASSLILKNAPHPGGFPTIENLARNITATWMTRPHVRAALVHPPDREAVDSNAVRTTEAAERPPPHPRTRWCHGHGDRTTAGQSVSGQPRRRGCRAVLCRRPAITEPSERNRLGTSYNPPRCQPFVGAARRSVCWPCCVRRPAVPLFRNSRG